MWEIKFTKEAANYAIDSHPYNEQVLIAIETLAFTATGLSSEGTYIENDDSEDILIWEIADHLVYYQIFLQENRIRIEVIKPLT